MVKLSLVEIEELALTGGYSGQTYLSNVSAAVILAAFAWYGETYNWTGAGYFLTDAEKDRIEEIAAIINKEAQVSQAGQIVMSVKEELTVGTLLCDGTEYMRVDYPELFAAIDGFYHNGLDYFYVPDMQDRFPMGNNTSIGIFGGASTITLAEENLPEQTMLRTGGPDKIPLSPGIAFHYVTPGYVPIDITPKYVHIRYEIVTGR